MIFARDDYTGEILTICPNCNKKRWRPSSARQCHECDIADWKREWPNYCRACSGWGGATFYESHGFRGGVSEHIFDPCDALDETTCHRCRGPLDLHTGICEECGWNCDDGVPLL